MPKTQFLIIGQGLVGTVVAFELERRGIKPLVLDQQHHSSASKVAAGLFNPFVFKWITKSWNIDALMPVLLETYRGMEQQLALKFLHQNGIVRVISSEKELERWKKKRHRPDYAVHIGDDVEIMQQLGLDRGFGNIRIHSAGWLDIATMITAYRAYLISENRLVNEPFDHHLLKPGSPCTYRDIESDNIIFCEGAGVDHNPFFNHLAFRHTKGEVLDIEADITLETCLNYGQFLVPHGGNQFRTGTTYNWSKLNDEPTEEGLEKILRNHKEFFDSVPHVKDHRAGVRPTAADRRPFVGRHREHPNLSILNGTGSKGVLLAPWSARQLINHILNDEPLHPEIDVNRDCK